jgi:hypothetical protein
MHRPYSGQEGTAMRATISSTAKTNIGLAVSILGWIVMAFAIRHPGIELVLLDLGTLVAGFGLFIAGLLLMIWAER